MSEKFSVLFKHATSYANALYASMEEEPECEFDDWFHSVIVSKFAELVVREASLVADDKFNKGCCPVGGFILEHFGIEQ